MPLTFNQEFALGASNQPDYTKLDSLNVSLYIGTWMGQCPSFLPEARPVD